MVTAFGSDGLFRLRALTLQRRETLLGLDRVGADRTLLFLFSGVAFSFGGLLLGGCGHFGGRGHMFGGVEVADHHVGQLAFFLSHQVVFVAELAHDCRVVSQRGHQLANALFNPLGNDDLAFTCQKLYRTHLAHVHAHRVGGASGFLLDGG